MRQTTADTLAYIQQRLAALEGATGLKPPVPEQMKPLPPPMGNVHAMARSTQLVSTEQSRAVADRRAARTAAAAQHAQVGRYFAGPVDPRRPGAPSKRNRAGGLIRSKPQWH
jgi:hypothetical protein